MPHQHSTYPEPEDMLMPRLSSGRPSPSHVYRSPVAHSCEPASRAPRMQSHRFTHHDFEPCRNLVEVVTQILKDTQGIVGSTAITWRQAQRLALSIAYDHVWGEWTIRLALLAIKMDGLYHKTSPEPQVAIEIPPLESELVCPIHPLSCGCSKALSGLRTWLDVLGDWQPSAGGWPYTNICVMKCKVAAMPYQ